MVNIKQIEADDRLGNTYIVWLVDIISLVPAPNGLLLVIKHPFEENKFLRLFYNISLKAFSALAAYLKTFCRVHHSVIINIYKVISLHKGNHTFMLSDGASYDYSDAGYVLYNGMDKNG